MHWFIVGGHKQSLSSFTRSGVNKLLLLSQVSFLVDMANGQWRKIGTATGPN
jgi:hypothetical protein